MCYIIESKQRFDNDYMTVSMEKRDMDMDSMKIWITSDYDFLSITNSAKSDHDPFQFRVPFAGIDMVRIRIRETIIKPLNCKISEPEYVSEQQCLVSKFIDKQFSPCPIKCLSLQMKGFHYVNKSTPLINCAKLEDEICNGGPKVWNKLNSEFSNCLNPCKRITYKDSRLDLYEPMYLKKQGETYANFKLEMNWIRKVEREVLVHDATDAIGAIGGSMGLFLGFSFFDVISKFLDNLIMPLVNKF